MRRIGLGIATIALLAAGLSAVAGCSTPHILFETSGRAFSADSARALLAATDTSEFSGRPVANATELRHETLVSLRELGEEGAAVADLVTEALPTNTKAVPVRVEIATWNGSPAVVLIEAYGKQAGRLDQKRLWVLDSSTGAVLFSAAQR